MSYKNLSGCCGCRNRNINSMMGLGNATATGGSDLSVINNPTNSSTANNQNVSHLKKKCVNSDSNMLLYGSIGAGIGFLLSNILGKSTKRRR